MNQRTAGPARRQGVAAVIILDEKNAQQLEPALFGGRAAGAKKLQKAPMDVVV